MPSCADFLKDCQSKLECDSLKDGALLRLRSSTLILMLLTLGAPVAKSADPLDQWTLRSPPSIGLPISQLTFVNNGFVAIGDGGLFMTSSNGLDWAERIIEEDVVLSDVTYGKGQCVVVGTGRMTGTSRIYTSPDTAAWTLRQTAPGSGLAGVVFSGDRFVAVGYGYESLGEGPSRSLLLTSLDGMSWTPQESQTTNGLNKISYGNGLYVAVGNSVFDSGLYKGEAEITTSRDGLNWTPQKVPVSGTLGRVVWANNTFVAAIHRLDDALGQGFLRSTDGLVWERQFTGQTSFVALASAANRFVAVGRYVAEASGASEDVVMTSADAKQWTQVPGGGFASHNLQDVAYGNQTFIAVNRGGAFWKHNDGQNWQRTTGATVQQLSGVAYGNGRFVAAGEVAPNVLPEEGTVLISYDGLRWTQIPPIVTGVGLKGITFAKGLFIALADDSYYLGGPLGNVRHKILTSADGIVWTVRYTGNGGALNAVTFGQDKIVAVGSPGIALVSVDGVSWTRASTFPNVRMSSVAFGGGKFVGVGPQSTIVTSDDGLVWQQQTTPESCDFFGLAFGKGVFVTTGYLVRTGPVVPQRFRKVFVSTDGKAWRETHEVAVPFGAFEVGLAFGGGVFLIAGYPPFTSTNGLSWVSRMGPWGRNVTYLQGAFMAVAPNAIHQSGALEWLRLGIDPSTLRVDGSVNLLLEGKSLSDVIVESSSNLREWTEIFRSQPLLEGRVEFEKRVRADSPHQTFRARAIWEEVK
jgi:hypothetical protein